MSLVAVVGSRKGFYFKSLNLTRLRKGTSKKITLSLHSLHGLHSLQSAWSAFQHDREFRGMNMKKAPTASLHVITLVTADWYGSDSSWLISQTKIMETMKLFSAKLLGPN